MSDNAVATQTPLAVLGESSNYQPEILQTLLNKKQRLLSFDELNQNLSKLLAPMEDIKGAPELKAMEKTLNEFKTASTDTLTFITALDTDSKVDIVNTVDKTIKTLDENTDKTLALVEEAKTAEPEDTTTLDKARKSFLKLAKDTQPLSTQQKSLSESMQSEDSLVLDETEQAADYFLSSLAIALFNDILPGEDDESSPLAAIRQKVRNLTNQINDKLDEDLNAIVHDEKFKTIEANWLGLHDLIESTDWSADVMIDVFDCTKEELGEDLENNAVDLINGEFFKKFYVAEYDQFGGLPYGAIIGLYEFENTREDRAWLSTMGKLANASHAPFISSVGPKFFGCKNIEEMADIRDLRAHMSHPRFEKWQAMRDTEEAAYLGLTLPRFLLRAPYHPENNPAGAGLTYEEEIRTQKGGQDFLWCNASLLFAKNMIGSFINSGWCQYLRGPKGGGKIEHLPRYAFDLNGQQEIKAPIEMVIPDYRELAFADLGFIPLIYRKGGSEACFFSSQSIKKSKRFKDPHDSENSQLVTNLSYTLSITRIAHYVKCIMRDNIGSSADGPYINNVLQTWLSQYVTTVVNPDDLTLRYYPFKAAQVITTPQEGMIGWYNSEITILPHIQFEGLDVELKMDVRI